MSVLRVEANGICLTDYHIWHGGWPWVGIQTPVPIVLGHEYCGVVEEVGAAVQGFKKGDRVVVPFNHSCGICEQCRSGHENVCLDVRFPMFHYTGGYGQYAKVSRAAINLVPLPESISFVDAAGMGCRYMTSWHGVVDQARVTAGEWVVVFGCGGVGLAAVNIASALGASVIAVSRTQSKLDLATELGAVATVNASGDNVAGQIVELTGGGAHVSSRRTRRRADRHPGAVQPADAGPPPAPGHLQQEAGWPHPDACRSDRFQGARDHRIARDAGARATRRCSEWSNPARSTLASSFRARCESRRRATCSPAWGPRARQAPGSSTSGERPPLTLTKLPLGLSDFHRLLTGGYVNAVERTQLLTRISNSARRRLRDARRRTRSLRRGTMVGGLRCEGSDRHCARRRVGPRQR